MNRIILSMCIVLTFNLYYGLAAVPAAELERDLATEVRSVFSAKCAGCHGPNLAKPKGRFGYVLDLARVAGNRDMVVPSFPEESELWELVRRGEMPLGDSPTGPLSDEEKDVIRNWIAAGAPAGPIAPTDSHEPAASNPQEMRPTPKSPPLEKSIFRYFGPFHLV